MDAETQKVDVLARRECDQCGGECEWFIDLQNKSSVVEGRLRTGDVSCVFVLGCTECGETIRIINADTVAEILNSSTAFSTIRSTV